MPERFSIAQVSPYPWEDEHEVNAFVDALSGELADARPPRRGARADALDRARARLAAPDPLRRAVRPGGRGAGARRRRAAAAGGRAARRDAGAAAGHLAHDRGGAVDRAARLRARPRAVRAQRGVGRAAPLALAQRRLLPRARRARALDAGGAPLRRAVLRPPRRAHRVVRGHARPDAAGLPRRLPRPAPGRGAGPSAPTARRPAQHRVLRPGGARRAAAVPARAAPAAARARVAGDGVRALRRGADDPLAPARPRAGALRAGHDRRPRCSPRADVVVAASLGVAPAPGLLVRALGAGAVPVASHLARLRGGREPRRRPRAAVRARRRRHARRPARAADPRRRPALDAARARPARHATTSTGRAWRRASRRSTPRSPRAATSPRATPRCGARLAEPHADRRRPAHAHRPLERLRDAGRGAARQRARRRPRARSR